MTRAALLPLLLLLPPLAGAQTTDPATDLGRLFHTPDMRATLDRQRATRQSARPQPAPREVRLDGIVRRSDGSATVWLDGQAHQGGTPGLSAGVSSARIRQEGGASVEVPVGGVITVSGDGH